MLSNTVDAGCRIGHQDQEEKEDEVDRNYLADMRDELDIQRQRIERSAPRSPQTGTAANETVQVTISAQGLPERIVVWEGWKSYLSREGLGSAVVEAYGSAAEAVLKEWDTLMAEDAQRPDPRPRPTDTFGRSFAGQFAETLERRGGLKNTQRFFLEFASLLRDINDNVEGIRRNLEENLSRNYRGTDANGVVSVELSASGTILKVDFDQAWIPGRSAADITTHLNEALEKAKRLVTESSASAMVESERLTKLLDLMNNPEALAERLDY